MRAVSRRSVPSKVNLPVASVTYGSTNRSKLASVSGKKYTSPPFTGAPLPSTSVPDTWYAPAHRTCDGQTLAVARNAHTNKVRKRIGIDLGFRLFPIPSPGIQSHAYECGEVLVL